MEILYVNDIFESIFFTSKNYVLRAKSINSFVKNQYYILRDYLKCKNV